MSRHIPAPRNKHGKPIEREPSEPLEQTIMVRLLADCGRLPKGFVYLLPIDIGRTLIHKRVATCALAVATADLELGEEEWEAATA